MMTRNPFTPMSTVGPDPNKRMGFMPTNKEIVATRGVKIKTKAAEQQAQAAKDREEYKSKFETNADKTIQYHNEKGNRAVEVISNFLKMVDDKTLARNRGSIADDVEKEIRKELLELALDLNNDETEEDNGKGSVVVLAPVIKIILMYRDRLNNIEYELQQLKQNLNLCVRKPLL
jgi:hypothetical protein